MKQKGFTLVELIAVVVVLAVIALIAVPNVMSQMESTRKEAYKASVQSVFDAVTTYLAQNETIDDIPSSGILVPESDIYKQLDLKNQNFISGKIYRGDDGVLMVRSISDGIYCADGSKNELEIVKGACELLDESEPEIVVVVNRVTIDSITVSVNSSDMESGISSYEYYLDGELKEKNKDNVYTFDKLEAGKTYTITVKSTNGNNKTAEKTITVSTASREVIYKQTPEGWSHSKTITINFPKTSDNEQYQYKVIGSTDWITVPTNTVDVFITEDSTIHVKIFESGVEIFDEQKTFAQIDNDPPVITSVNGNTESWATKKTLTIDAYDSERGLADKAYSFDGGFTWQSSNSKEFKSEGVVQIAVKDGLDNVATTQVEIVNIDTTVPLEHVITATAGGDNYISGTWTNQSVTLQANPNPATTDSGYTYKWYKKDGNVFVSAGTGKNLTLSEDGVSTWRVDISTGAGGGPTVSTNEFTVKIDKTAPTCGWSGENTSWSTSIQKITATCSDSGSLCKSDAETWTFDGTTKTETLTYVATDNAGNNKTCTKTLNVYVDRNNPDIKVTGTTNSTRAVGVNFTVDDGGIGVDSYTCTFGTRSGSGAINYNLAGTVTTSGSTISCTRDKLSAGTTYYYKITAKDKLANTATVTNSIATKSFSSITWTVSDESLWTTSKTVKITGATTGAQLQYQVVDYVSGTTASPDANNWTNITSGTTITISKKQVVFARFTDGYNTTSPTSKTITKIDIVNPTISALTSSSTTKSITLNYTHADADSGVASHKCYFKNNTYTNGYIEGTASSTGCTISGLKNGITYDYKIVVVDNVGHETTKTGQMSTGNFGTCSVTVPGGWAKSKTVTVKGATTGANLQYRIGSSGTWTNISNGGTLNLTYDTTVYCRLWDGTNASSTATGTVNVDTSTPSVSITATSSGSAISSGAWSNYHTVSLQANPSGSESGYTSYQWYRVTASSSGYSYSAISGATKQTYSYSSDTSGTMLAVKVTNGAGTTSNYSSIFTVRIDTCASPTLSYGSYGSCSASCGGGTKYRTVTKTGISGRACGSYQESASCNTQACVICGWSMDATRTVTTVSGKTSTKINMTFSTSSSSQNCTLTGVSRINVDSSNNYLCYIPTDSSFTDYSGAVSSLTNANVAIVNFGSQLAAAALCMNVSFGGITSSGGKFYTTINNAVNGLYIRAKYQGTFSNSSTKEIEYLYFPQGMVDYAAWSDDPSEAYYWKFD